MARNGFQIEYLRTPRSKRVKQQAFATAGSPGDDPELKRDRKLLQIVDHAMTERLVAALKQAHTPTDAGQDGGQCAGAVAASPAVDQGAPLAGLLRESGLKELGDVAGNQCGADALCNKT